MNLFKSKKAPIQMGILDHTIKIIQEYNRGVQASCVPSKPVPSKQVKVLQELGFTNTKIVQEYKLKVEQFKRELEARKSADDYKKYVRESVEVLLDARQRFGADTLLIRFDDFELIMNKFNLVCGTFDMYKGDIPDNCIAEIAWLETELYKDSLSMPKYITSLRAIEEVRITNEFAYSGLPAHLIRFPFFKCIYPGEFRDFHGNNTDNYNLGYRLYGGKYARLFICAPANDMKKLRHVVSFRRATDPFICAHTKYGILVFTRWGEEADSPLIKKYEQLNELISKLG